MLRGSARRARRVRRGRREAIGLDAARRRRICGTAGWEAARTEIVNADVLAGAGEKDRARDLLSRATPTLERLRSVRELARAEDLAGRLS